MSKASVTGVFEVGKVAKLASLPLTEEESRKYIQQLADILSYVEKLGKVDTSEVEPLFNVTGNSNITRSDETKPSLTPEEVLSNASGRKKGYFKTKGVFGE